MDNMDGHVYVSGELSEAEVEALYSGFVDRAAFTIRTDPSYAADIASGSLRQSGSSRI